MDTVYSFINFPMLVSKQKFHLHVWCMALKNRACTWIGRPLLFGVCQYIKLLYHIVSYYTALYFGV